MKNDQWTTKEALTDLREATRLDLIFLQGCHGDEDWNFRVSLEEATVWNGSHQDSYCQRRL